MICIYGLVDPHEPDRIRYVGKTNDPANRLAMHVYQAKKGQTHKDRWVRTLIRDGRKPAIVELEWVDDDQWQDEERRWIAKLSGLCNTTAGGEGVDCERTEIWRARIGQAHKGKAVSPETRAKLSESVRALNDAGCKRGHAWTPENTRITKDGHRVCRTCAREWAERDRRRKGRPTREVSDAERQKSTCKRGHDMSGDNLRLLTRKDGRTERICRSCVRIRNRACRNGRSSWR